MMKILVISSCSKKKKFKHKKQPKCKSLRNKLDRLYYSDLYPQYSCSASSMYIGRQYLELKKGVKILKRFANVDFFILSAGFGLINNNETITAYDCSFSSLNKEKIIDRAALLEIPNNFQRIVENDYDFIYLALGKKYLIAMGNWSEIIKTTTIAFQSTKNNNILSLNSNNQINNIFRNLGYKMHSSLYFKGDFLKILAEKFVDMKLSTEMVKKILSDVNNLSDFIENVLLKERNKQIFDYI